MAKEIHKQIMDGWQVGTNELKVHKPKSRTGANQI